MFSYDFIEQQLTALQKLVKVPQSATLHILIKEMFLSICFLPYLLKAATEGMSYSMGDNGLVSFSLVFSIIPMCPNLNFGLALQEN